MIDRPRTIRWFSAASFLALATVTVSLAVAYHLNGSLFKTAQVADLRSYGGTTFEDLAHLELWRLATAQLVHAKIPHMLFNALCLFLLGSLLQQAIGSLRLIFLWLVAGGLATAISPVLIEAPWNVGTGASQAVFAFAGCSVVLAIFGAIDWRPAFGLAALVLVTGLALDLAYAGYPKPGHVSGFIFGAALGAVFIRLRPDVQQAN
ncbi:rhomboid family intramembrane serine protease [Hyphomicrobium sp.]|uniref:rhomboid family intramembrane serine protease n=1 Tax=Hyphomicrobium sp. TaxID=82 RepID=UPI002D76FC25|nr:rhomboid family intramembrane serine protease [Hyphomicrobium sp.]HET6390199.1 rhomboid family intramembrane serine protease [Hyphomicrobium sp.]